MNICSGSGKTELLEKLKQINDTAGSFNLVSNGEVINITMDKSPKGLGTWKIESNKVSAGEYKTGTGLEALNRELKNLNSVKSYMELYVIALLNAEPERTYNGDVITKWAVVDPYDPYEYFEDHVGYQTVDLPFTQKEYIKMQETGIALWDKDENAFYPFKHSSTQSIGRLLDCQQAFSIDIPLHSAVLIADRITEKNNVYFLHRNKNDRVRPVYAVISERFKQINELDFMINVLNEIGNGGIYTVPRWTIYDNETVVEVHRNPRDDITFGYFISCGNAPGKPVKAIAFAKLYNNYIYISTRKKSHKKVSENDVSIVDMEDSFDVFYDLYDEIAGIVLTPEDMENIINAHFLKVLGIRRLNNLSIPDEDMTGKDFLIYLLQKTNIAFNRKSEKWQIYLREAYFHAMKRMVSEDYEF